VKGKSTLSILREACRGICIKRLTNRLGAWHGRRSKTGFTLIELLVVIAVIIVLAGLILSTFGYVQKKAARVRVETEIAALSSALESYKADNGIYPRDPTPNTATDMLNSRTDGNPMPSPTPGNPSGATYPPASLVLYRALSGDRNLDGAVTSADEALDIDGSTLSSPLTQLPTPYFTFKPNMLNATTSTDANGNTTTTVNYIRDPFGNSYGYSTIQAATGDGTKGYNPTFDLWSTAGTTSGSPTDLNQWIKNW
jgi:prepilin-type N-terminal cleavage/methylation domain-containing protein